MRHIFLFFFLRNMSAGLLARPRETLTVLGCTSSSFVKQNKFAGLPGHNYCCLRCTYVDVVGVGGCRGRDDYS